MKIKNVTFGKYLALSILILPFVFVSCEEESLDLRDEVLGYYNYEIKAYIDTGEELVYIGDEPGHYDVTGTALLAKSPDYIDMIDFWDGPDLLFQGIDLQENDNTISFDIPLQEFWVGPVPVTVRGYDNWNVNGVPYHGAYIYEDEIIEIGMYAEVMDIGTDLVLIFTAYRD